MIIRDRPDTWQILTAVRGSVLPQVTPSILIFTLIACSVVLLDRLTPLVPHLNSGAYTVFGIGLSLFLGFRNNAAYDRWWEARKNWGGLLADLRSYAREAEIFVKDDARRKEMLSLSLDFLHSHRMSLRKLPFPQTGYGAAFGGSNAPACAALNAISDLVARAHRDGHIDGFGAMRLTERLASMNLHQANCERIANSPLPFVYSLLVYRTSWLYCLLLPLALVQDTGWLTPMFSAVVAYMFLGLAEVTEELSHPFGRSKNALPLDAICRASEISLAPHMGIPAPEPLAPKGHYLS